MTRCRSVSAVAFTYWLLFHSAREEILVATPYYLPDPNLQLGIEQAARRGVKVTLVPPVRIRIQPWSVTPVGSITRTCWKRGYGYSNTNRP